MRTADPAPARESEVAATLDDFHAAAASADFDRYFGHFAAGAVFLGTDPTERWGVAEFRAFAKPHFDRGKGWTYVPRARHIAFDPTGTTAWFDELLHNEKFGTCRGTGVLLRQEGAWRIALYSLSFLIPNDRASQVLQ